MIIWITGISGVGKTTLAKKLYKTLKKKKKILSTLMGINLEKC